MARPLANDVVAHPATRGGRQRQRSWLAYAVIAIASLLSAALQPVHADGAGGDMALLDSLSAWAEAAAPAPAPASAPASAAPGSAP